tara:strand:+ start:417 stop:728 length:312 start_codon:yes stop_codon:yes gene_type:complete
MYTMNTESNLISFTLSYSGEPTTEKDAAIESVASAFGGSVYEKQFDHGTWRRRMSLAFGHLTQARIGHQQAQILADMVAANPGDSHEMEVGPLTRQGTGDLLH